MVWQLGLTTALSCEFKQRANSLASLGLLSYSATTGMTLPLPRMLHTCANFGGLPVMSHPRVQLRVSASLHNLEYFFTFFHSLPLHDSHLNTRLLIAKIQVNLTWNKANKMIDKIQPYSIIPTNMTGVYCLVDRSIHNIDVLCRFKYWSCQTYFSCTEEYIKFQPENAYQPKLDKHFPLYFSYLDIKFTPIFRI